MIRFWRHCFYIFLISSFILKLLAFIFKIIGSTIILCSGFGNDLLFQNWYAIIPINNWGNFFLEQLFTFLCLIVSFYWIKKLTRAKRQNFKRFPGTVQLFIVFLILTSLSSHWAISLLFLFAFIFIKKSIDPTTKLFTQNSMTPV